MTQRLAVMMKRSRVREVMLKPVTSLKSGLKNQGTNRALNPPNFFGRWKKATSTFSVFLVVAVLGLGKASIYPAEAKEAGDDAAGQSQKDGKQDINPLGLLFGTARVVVEEAGKVATSRDGDDSPAAAIEKVADAIRNGLSTADSMLPPLDPKLAKQFGDSFRQTVLKDHRRTTDRKMINFVIPIWREVVRASHIPQQQLTITLVEDPEVNAFAFVGKNVVVNRGLVKFANDCAQPGEILRFMLAHELGHIVHQHTDVLFRRMVAADQIIPGARVAPAVVQMLVKQTPINQSAEREADCYARKIHLQEGWSLDGGKEFFERILQLQKPASSGGAIDSLFASHPDNRRRLELLESGDGCQTPVQPSDLR